MAARLTKEMKILIVTELASFTKATEIRDLLKKQFDIECSLPKIKYYDPSSPDTDVAQEWRDLFKATRERYIAECGRIPITHKAFRMNQLQKILEKETERGNTVGQRETLKQAAEEEGGAYTNKRELTGAGGKDLPVATLSVQFVQPDAKPSPKSEKANADG